MTPKDLEEDLAHVLAYSIGTLRHSAGNGLVQGHSISRYKNQSDGTWMRTSGSL